jgi:outer membrane protein OmpA-like peptidoglycan-associated protein
MVTIAGTILDNNGNPLINHQVWFRPSKYPDEAFRSTTDAKGRYVTKIFLNEPFFVEVEFDDVKVHSTDFTSRLKDGETQIFKDFTFEIPDHHPAYENLVVSTSNQDIARQEDELQSLDFIGSKYRSASSININNIYFEFESAVIKNESEEVVEKVHQMMEEFPTISIRIAGHTDNIGTHDFNMDLSRRRAESLKAALVARGVAADRIETVGYGETQPLVSNDNEFEGRELNRRIEITVIDRTL